MNLDGKVAIVTNGAYGVGRATSILLAKRGVKVVVHYTTNDTLAEDVVSDIRSNGGEAIALHAEIRSMDQVFELVTSTIKSFGHIDILVCNAITYFEAKSFEDMSWEEFSQKLNEELQTAFVTTKAVIPSMMKQQSGRIIYISNTHGKDPAPHMIALGTAKGGLDTFSVYIAQEFGSHGICANVVAPGYMSIDGTAPLTEDEIKVISQFTPLGRIAESDDVASVIAFLASDDARFVTGTYTPVTGGLTME
jgi:3-oxoacyl-[acyl-carrier protein] reductase